MKITKVIKDHIIKYLRGPSASPRGLYEMREYARLYGPRINFTFHYEDGIIVAVSEDFKHGSIVTSGKTLKELDKNIKDAILTSFQIPSAYSNEAGIKVGAGSKQYAIAQ